MVGSFATTTFSTKRQRIAAGMVFGSGSIRCYRRISLCVSAGGRLMCLYTMRGQTSRQYLDLFGADGALLGRKPIFGFPGFLEVHSTAPSHERLGIPRPSRQTRDPCQAGDRAVHLLYLVDHLAPLRSDLCQTPCSRLLTPAPDVFEPPFVPAELFVTQALGV